MTKATARSVDLQALVRDAFSSVAVTAYARGVDLTVHLDQRLPASALGDSPQVCAYLRRALARTIEAGRTDRLALALWLEPDDAGGRIVVEAGRALGPAGPSPARLADLWALPLDGSRTRPQPHRQDARAETVLVPLPLTLEPDAPPLAQHRRETFEGLYILQVRDALIDTARMRASLAALGLETDVAASAEEVLALARNRVEAGGSVDLVLMDARAIGAAAVELARAFRGDPRLATAVIVPAGIGRAGRGEEGRDGEAGLFDADSPARMPWRGMLDRLQDLVEARVRAAARSGTAPADAPADAPAIPDLAGRRILIAEDVDTNQVLLRAILEPTGATVETVAGGDEVLARHAEAPADLIVMDLQMPGTGGLAAARRIRALEGAAATVPIIALTAHAGSGDRARAASAGMDAYLPKPVVVSEFYELVRRLLAAEDSSP